MNRKDLELMFWIPVGIMSLMSIWILEPDSAIDPVVNEFVSTLSDGSRMRGAIEYSLVENTTLANAHDERCTVLRYAAQIRKYGQSSLQGGGTVAPVSVMDWTQLLLGDGISGTELMWSFVDVLASAPMGAYFFETRGVGYNDSHSVGFEFALVESPYLERFADGQEDPNTFGDHFEGECKGNEAGCVFFTPSKESVLIAPMKLNGANEKNDVYGHLAAFVRRAPRKQIEHYWRLVLKTYVERLQETDPHKVWLSTDGTGVAWLHARLDPRPKYYDYKPFTE